MPAITRNVPAAAFLTAAGPFQLGDNGDGAKSAPFRAIARSAEPMDHWFFGPMIHDFAGMQVRARIAIDYCHDPKEVIGFASKFNVGAAGLEVAGALTPYGQNDRATEILTKARAGVPYEASIDWRGPAVMEDVPAGRACQVNGRQFAGPLTVVRQWQLRGLAICPHGMDSNTSAQFSAPTGEIPVTYLSEDTAMAEAMKSAEAAQQAAAVDAQPAKNPAELAQSASVDAAPVPPVQTAPEAAQQAAAVEIAAPPEPPGKRFLAAFGDLGGRWFAEGLTFDQATAQFASHQAGRITALEAECAELKLRIAQASRGAKPVTAQPSTDIPPDPKAEKRAKRLAELTAKLGSPAVAAVALRNEEHPVGPQN